MKAMKELAAKHGIRPLVENTLGPKRGHQRISKPGLQDCGSGVMVVELQDGLSISEEPRPREHEVVLCMSMLRYL